MVESDDYNETKTLSQMQFFESEFALVYLQVSLVTFYVLKRL